MLFKSPSADSKIGGVHHRQFNRWRYGKLPGTSGRRVGPDRSLQYGTGILGSAMVGAFADGSPWPMGWVIALSGIVSMLCAWLLVPAAATTPYVRRSKLKIDLIEPHVEQASRSNLSRTVR